MIKNYFKIAWRNFQKQKGFTFINLVGLATGFAITLLIVQYVRYEFSYEDTHSNADQVVRLTIDHMDGESVTAQDCETHPPLGPRLMTEIPEVVDFTRAYQIGEPSVNVKAGEETFLVERMYAADTSFFNLFTYPLKYGNQKEIFRQPNQAVLTETTALRFFNRKDAVGERINMPTGEGNVPLAVVGIVPDSPSNTHLKFDILISYATMLGDPALAAEYGEREENWDGNNTYTYALLAPKANFENFSRSLEQLNQHLKEEKKLRSSRFIGQMIKDIHLYSNKPFEPETNGSATSVYFLLGVAFLVIISAFVNYVNLATSRALDRAKEVGIRKVVGSSKGQLRIQFLTESFLMNICAAVLAAGMIWLVKQQFIELAGLPKNFSVFGDSFFWMILSAFVLLGVIFSGIYPALVLSSFRPSAVLKGSFTHSTQGALLRKGLVIFQFAITTILLIQTFTVTEQLKYIRNMDRGANTDKTIVVEAPPQKGVQDNFPVFKDKLLAQSNVQSVSVSGSVPGQKASHMSTTTGIKLREGTSDNNYNFYITYMDSEFIPQMGMELVAGENFLPNNQHKHDVIVNEKAINLWGITNPEEVIGKTLNVWGQIWTIRGVLKNYHQESPKSPFIPIIHRQYERFDAVATVHFTGGSPTDQVHQLKEAYSAAFPNMPFSYFFMDSEYDKQFKADERFRNVFGILTGFSILIAFLGLLGLASFTVAKRKKEIGIRKVVGASVFNVLVLLSGSFLKTVSISVLIGVPVTYLLLNSWLENFAFRIELSWWLFALPVVLVLVLVVLSVCINTLRVATANPVKSLRTE
jgi:putative ABC transport system permease protein